MRQDLVHERDCRRENTIVKSSLSSEKKTIHALSASFSGFDRGVILTQSSADLDLDLDQGLLSGLRFLPGGFELGLELLASPVGGRDGRNRVGDELLDEVIESLALVQDDEECLRWIEWRVRMRRLSLVG